MLHSECLITTLHDNIICNVKMVNTENFATSASFSRYKIKKKKKRKKITHFSILAYDF